MVSAVVVSMGIFPQIGAGEQIEWAFDGRNQLAVNAEIQHGRFNPGMAQEYLDGPQVRAHIQKMRGKAMALMPSSA